MEMTDRTNFRLPGYDLNPFSERKCLLSLLSAYSRQWNPRNLEAPWYEPWSQILANLVNGDPSLSAAPQPYLWYDPTSQPHTTPGPAHLLSNYNEQNDLDDDEQDGVGNVTLDSIRSISIPSHRNRSRIPDFAITRKVSFLRPTNDSQLIHLDRRVTYLGIPLLVELKTSGARCQDVSTSLMNAIKPMNFARDQLFKQAYHLFRMYPHQESVILLAVSGFWWTYFIYIREFMEGQPPPVDGEDDDDDDDEALDFESGTGLPQNGIHAPLAQNPLGSDETPSEVLQEHLYGFPLSALADVQNHPRARFHTVLPQGKIRLREPGHWSDYLLYGTAPSNQVLSLILDRLHSVIQDHYDGRMG